MRETPPLRPPKWGIPIVQVPEKRSGENGLSSGSDEAGILSSSGMNMMQLIFNTINGLTPTIPCTAAYDTNLYVLTPFTVSPQFADYYDHASYAFVAPSNSTGLVTATIVPRTGAAATLKVYKTNGSAQATSGDIVANLFYLLYYVSTLDGGNGGLVLK